MARGSSPQTAAGQAKALSHRRAEKDAGMAAAIEWRESRRCKDCGALAYTPCAHRPDGFGSSAPVMPFAGHRNCAEWELAATRETCGDGAAYGQRPERGEIAPHKAAP